MAVEAKKADEVAQLRKEIADLEAKKRDLAKKAGLHLEDVIYERVVPPGPMPKVSIIPKINEYVSPFGYSNVTLTGAFAHFAHGTELEPTGAITITEATPIISVSVIGSACTPPGYLMLSIPNMDKKLQSVENLMGTHDLPDPSWCRENTAFFEVDPGTRTITLTGGSRNPANNAYAVRVIRVTVS